MHVSFNEFGGDRIIELAIILIKIYRRNSSGVKVQIKSNKIY